MLADESAHILSVRSGFAPEARRVRRVAKRKLAAVQNLLAMQVGQRHFGGGHQIEIPLPCNLEQILLELGQLAGAGQRRRVRHERRLDLDVLVFARVKVEHEVDERAREARAGAAEHGESRAGNARGALEIQNAERRAQVPVRQRREIECARLAMAADFGIVVGALPHRHARVREIRQLQQRRVAPVLDTVQLDAELADLRSARFVRFLKRRSVLALPLCPRDLVARRVLLALQSLKLGDNPPPCGFERRDLLEGLIGIEPAVAESATDVLDVIANVGWVEHAPSAPIV